MSATLGGGKTLEHVERLCPGFKVIEGPFDVAETSPGWRAEQVQARGALQLLRGAGVESRLVIWREQAYVLRSAKGWRESGNLSLTQSLKDGGCGLHCPLCGYGPYRHARALGLHRCLRVPGIKVGGREVRGRLSNEQIQQAVEAAGLS